MIRDFTIVILFLGLVILGCKKKDTTTPDVTIALPNTLSHYNYNDEITITGSASDETALDRVDIKLLYADQTSTDFSFSLSAKENGFDFKKTFDLDDKHMLSGTIYIKVIAIDKAGNKNSAFREITYTELPLALEHIFVVDRNSASFTLSKVDGMNTTSIQSFNGDFQDMEANSYWQQLVFSGGTSGGLFAYNPIYDEEIWHRNSQNTALPFFADIKQVQSNKSMFVAQGNSTVVSYDKKGQELRTYSLDANEYGGELVESGEFVLIEKKGLSGIYNLGTYFKSTGGFKQDFLVGGNIIKMLPKTDDEIYLLIQNNNQCKLGLYSIHNNSFWEPHTLPNGVINDACMVSSNEIIIAHSSGMLRYTFNNNSLITTNANIISQLEYDPLSGIIYATEGNKLKSYDHLGNFFTEITHSSAIDKFVLYYNK